MRLLLLSANFGSGHLQAARAVAQAHLALHPANEALLLNFNDPLTRLVAEPYLRVIRWAPGLYRRVYQSPASPFLNGLIELAWQQACADAIGRFRPDLVVATHPFPGLALAALRKRGAIAQPVSAIVTDWDAHPLWLHQGFDRYFVAADSTRQGFEALGIPAERIEVTGIPVRPAFERAGALRSGNQILVMGGGLGLGPIAQAVRSLAELAQPELRVTILCGQNGALYRALTKRYAADPRFTILGYLDEVDELMARADLLLSKPGGITSSEALAMGLPLLLLTPLPGQEEENAQRLLELGAARMAGKNRIGQAAVALLQDRGALAAMAAASRKAGRPTSAHLIATRLREATAATAAPSGTAGSPAPVDTPTSG